MGVVKHLRDGATLYDLTGIHDSHPVADLGHDAQVVGNQQQGGTELFLQLVHQFQHLGLDGHVQGGGGLVRQNQLRRAGDAHGDDHPLLHAAGELVGILVIAGPGDAHHLQHIAGLSPALLLAALFMLVDDLRDLIAHGVDRVQAGHRVLENHRDLAAADLPQTGGLGLEHILALEPDLAAHDLARRVRDEPQDRQGRGSLAGAGLAHQTQALALSDGQVQAVDGVDHVLVGVVLHPQAADIQQGLRGLRGGNGLRLWQSGLVLFVLFHVASSLLSSSAWGPGHPAGRLPAGSGRGWST